MPITKELNNIKKLEAVGFPHEQAETLADIIEQSHIDSQQSLKEFIGDKLDAFSKEIRNEIINLELRTNNKMSEMEAKLRASQADLLMKYSAIIAGFITMALTIAKLLW